MDTKKGSEPAEHPGLWVPAGPSDRFQFHEFDNPDCKCTLCMQRPRLIQLCNN